MSEKRFRVMSNESKQLYCIESVDGEMFSMQEIVDMLNSLEEENEQLRNENKEMRHELDSLSGCYCADNKEFKDYWRIEYGE